MAVPRDALGRLTHFTLPTISLSFCRMAAAPYPAYVACFCRPDKAKRPRLCVSVFPPLAAPPALSAQARIFHPQGQTAYGTAARIPRPYSAEPFSDHGTPRL